MRLLRFARNDRYLFGQLPTTHLPSVRLFRNPKMPFAFHRIMDITTVKNRSIYFAAFVVCVAAAVFLFLRFGKPNSIQPANDIWPTRQELRSKMREIRKELLVYGTGQKTVTESYRRLADQYAKEMRWLQVIVKPDTSVTPAEIDSLPLWLIGTPVSNSLIARIAESLPIKIAEQKFSFSNAVFSNPNDVYLLSLHPNPMKRGLPISILSGNTDSAVVDVLKEYSRNFRAGDLQVFRDGQAVVYVFFKQEGNGPWKIDRDQTRNYLNTSHVVAETEHYRFIFHGENVQREKIQAFAAVQEQRVVNLLSQLNHSGEPFPKISYHLYESFEDKGLMTRNTDISHFDFDKWQVHTIFNDNVSGDFFADARLHLKKYLGESESPALVVGAAIYFTESWGGDGFKYWAKRFLDTDNVNPLSDLLNPDIFARESYLFMRPLAGSFVEFLIEKYGWNEFLDLYRRWPKSGLPNSELDSFTMAALERGWRQHLENMNNVEVREANGESLPPVFQKGFCYAHEGYQIYNGYLSRRSLQSLEKMRSLGTDWISVTPFGYLENRNQPSPFHYSFGAGAENDESLIAAAIFARQLGMRVMLKPHVLMSGGDWGWPGEIDMKTEENWQQFFKYYYSWIRHYALLAEMYDFDIFCIGVEFLHATPNHDAEWRAMIEKIRKLYHGQLVYAANWYEEFERITFWDALDYIGLNLYYPLSEKDTANLDELKKGMNTGMPVIERIVKKYNKPLLLTEVGFTSTAAPWKTPHERNRQAPLSLEDQALCYQAIFESFCDQEWFYGFYWWKWPTYLEYGGPANSDFTPNGKPAEQVVAEWYSRIWKTE